MWNYWKSSPDGKRDGSGSYSRIAETDNGEQKEQCHTAFDDEDDEEVEFHDDILRPGDHVYVWKSAGVLRAYQKHAIVLSVEDNEDLDSIKVVSFYDKEARDKQSLRDDREGNDQFLNESEPGTTNNEAQETSPCQEVSLAEFSGTAKVHKVQYGSGVAKRLLSRPGTVTACKADQVGLVIARARYLLQNSNMLPPHHLLSATGECAAVWCRIGRWCTLQGSSILQIMFVGQAGGAAAGGLLASNVFVLAPMPGFWGAIGFFWYVPATVAFPVIVPLLVTFGLMSLVPLEILRRYRKKWKATTFSLNHDFWLHASDDVKEDYFGTTDSADDDWMREFFGMDTDENERGKYMPLDGDDLDADDSDMIERHQESIAAAYQIEMGNGHPSSHQNLFLQHMDMMKKKWTDSWTKYLNKIRGGSDEGRATRVPLKRQSSEPYCISSHPLANHPWASRSRAEPPEEQQYVLSKHSKSWSVRNRTTPSLELLDEEEEDSFI